jgi:hypothetical protein
MRDRVRTLGRRRLAVGFLGLGVVGVAGLLIGYGTSPSAEATIVSVIAGKPREYAFTLSKASNLPWLAKTSSATVTSR